MLIAMAIFLAIILLLGNDLQWENYRRFYITFIPVTIILPLIVGITTALSYKRVVMSISPTSNVNVDKLKDFFFKEDYIIVDEKENYFHFERNKLIPRFLTLNYDKPTITVEENAVKINMLKRLSLVILPQFEFGKRYELNPESDKDA